MNQNIRIAIIGLGNMGTLIYQSLKKIGFSNFVLVDPSQKNSLNCLSSISSIPFELFSKIDLWILATPTNLHFRQCLSILSKNPAAKILCEKPFCSRNEITFAENTLSLFPQANIGIHNIYGESGIIDQLFNFAGLSRHIPLTLRAELSKDRRKDESEGRFIDTSYGMAGYEGYHLLSFIESIFMNDPTIQNMYSNFINIQNNEIVWKSVFANSKAFLFSNITGERLSSPSARWIFDKASKRYQQNISGEIRDSQFRYRYLEVAQNNIVGGILWEPFFDALGFKNKHLIYAEREGKREYQVIEFSMIEHSLRKQITQLFTGDIKLGFKKKSETEKHKCLSRLSTELSKFHSGEKEYEASFVAQTK